jgi:hypothetical protein
MAALQYNDSRRDADDSALFALAQLFHVSAVERGRSIDDIGLAGLSRATARFHELAAHVARTPALTAAGVRAKARVAAQAAAMPPDWLEG